MFNLALQVFFAGLLLALVVHPWAGLALVVAAILLATWRVWALFALPFLWLGMKGTQHWATHQAARIAAKASRHC